MYVMFAMTFSKLMSFNGVAIVKVAKGKNEIYDFNKEQEPNHFYMSLERYPCRRHYHISLK